MASKADSIGGTGGSGLAVNGETRLLGIVGENIAYTRSPAMHNRAAALLRLDQIYLPFPLPAAALGGFLDVFWRLGGVGLNVTTPHKTAVAELLRARGVPDVPQSVNTLYRPRGGDPAAFWAAVSTDGEGFARGLARMSVDAAALEEVVMIGSGGAALALAAHLGAHGTRLRRLTVLRRSSRGDAALKAAVPARLSLRCEDLTLATLTAALKGKGETCLLVQATNAPQAGDDLQGLTPALKTFAGFVTDIVYGKPSALYFAALAKDLKAQDGEAMLIEQARLSQQLWWGKAASYEDMAAALRGK
jgi:shikimate dehydrogenase